MNCQHFRQILDSYISDELLVETNHEVLRHLENCPACREELAAARFLRTKLRSAVKNAADAQPNPNFAANLRNSLRETALRPKWYELTGLNSFFNLKTATATLGLLIIALLGIFLIHNRNSTDERNQVAENQSNISSEANRVLENTSTSENPAAQAVAVALREMTESAVGDHRNCALKFRLKERPISLEEAAIRYEKFNDGLKNVVVEAARAVFPENSGSQEIKLLAAHSCVFNGRRFAHIVLQRQNHIISVLTTDSDAPQADAAAIISQTTDNMQVASFQTKNHFVFVVSDLDAAENMTIAKTVIPAISRHLGKFEV